MGKSPPHVAASVDRVQARTMSLAVLTLTAAQLFDLGTFIRMVGRHGSAAEANPIVSGLLHGHGLEFALVAKIVALSVVVAVTVVLSQHPEDARPTRLATLIAAVAVVAGLVGGLSNALVILGHHV
jgi:hypothetical protein